VTRNCNLLSQTTD